MNSENRQEVAARLREAIIDDGHLDMPGGKQGFQMTLQRLIGTSNPTRPALYARLADLIDPTCRNTLPQNWGTFECSECGAQFEVCSVFMTESGNDDSEPIIPNYCPECGERVVDDSRESGSCACWSASLIDEDRRLYDIQIDLADEDAMAAIGSILGMKTGGDAHGNRSAD